MIASMMELAAKACAKLQSEEAKLAWLDGYAHGIRQTNANWDSALAAGSRRAKTAKPVECEASQSGDAKQRNAQPPSHRIEQLNKGGSK